MVERDSVEGQGKVVVIGGGLAGIASACYLADRGHPVVLMEKRSFLGGRAFSFPEPETGLQMDNGQHVFLGCCTFYINLLGSLQAHRNTHLQESLFVPVLDRTGRRGVLRGAALPAPFHLLPSLLAYPHLSWMDKLRVLYGGLRIHLADRRRDESSLEYETFADWLKRHGQSDEAIDRFWNLVVLPTLNDDASQVSANMGLKVFKEGVLQSRESGSMGYARVGLSELVSDGAIDYLSSRGGEVMLGTGVRELIIEGDRVCGVRTSRGDVHGDWYVLALASHDLGAVLPPAVAADGFFSLADHLSYSPIVNVHVWYDRPVMDDEFAGFVDSPLQWVFNKTRMQGDDDSTGQYVCISLSGAWEYADLPRQRIGEMFLEEMARVFPQARDARVERLVVVKQPRATFRSVPGASSFRLPVTTPISNLFLAGEWVNTDWPGTMEGAVRSGYAAALAISSRARGE
ncbi:MAG: hydroxysqualene dehydroxylase HpnE [Chloroflexota bacterium]|nr:hydroxysqualene dehydroxylase HpnE [Chloroflexota bacterium]MDE2941952.1 hydroxysqualene dehydroxylase HpnE [Chloroflexota bacterium]MDE3268611.1 hydroxysqualene dehydroxylase HpnE [Chloroflexota bacterium]